VSPAHDDGRAWAVGLAGFALMLTVGTMYALGAVQAELPRLFALTPAAALTPFAAASLGLAAGTGLGRGALRRWGPRATAMAGAGLWGLAVAFAGLALGHDLLVGAVACLAVGGVGVGAAYLTIIATVGPRFAARPLIGSAIGPLGFATGSALFFVASATTDQHSPADAGAWLAVVGVVLVLVVLALGWGLPPTRPRTQPPATTSTPTRRRLSALLFVNALPGMLLLAVVVPLFAGSTTNRRAEEVIAATLVALFLGGLLAPRIRDRLGPERAFAVLLAVRGVLLVVLPFTPSLPTAIVLLAVVLFGHGAGFSLLPGLVRGRLPGEFADEYGRVLVVWGLSGVVGSALAALSVSIIGGYAAALAVAGVVALVGAAVLAARRATT
jgi:hypothetical protein